MQFTEEKAFEDALVQELSKYGWDPRVLEYKSEDELLENWARILFENNRERDRLNEVPLTSGEKSQILEQLKTLRTPCKLNGFINGKEVRIKRDAPEDFEHFGKDVTLRIYDRNEIAGGKSRYQIARQPRFSGKPGYPKKRGDLCLLINGMPVIHIELKKSGVPLSAACNQIETYMSTGVFDGLFSLVQVFVAMTPEETVYFANPGPDGKFRPEYRFHWADANNEPMNDWRQIASRFLMIPMAHQLIGFYTVADAGDSTLKVMRSYQYYASSAISTEVSRRNWDFVGKEYQRGGYIWHTTGSGKTLTSFKTAHLIAESGDADKVVFLMDRVELGTQSLAEYRGFSPDDIDVQGTENTSALLARLKSTSPNDRLVVTSIQKAALLRAVKGVNDLDFELLDRKRIVFIVDECHRSTFGDMLYEIKENFPRALFFGFTGTPIFEKNQKKHSETSEIFGKELHRYSVADGIRDKNVLGFDPVKVLTFRDKDIREQVGLMRAKAKSVEDAFADPKKKEAYMRVQNMPMPRLTIVPIDPEGKKFKEIKGVEEYLPVVQYSSDQSEHRKTVVRDILENWTVGSVGGKFHAILATSSIVEAIKYYRLFKEQKPDMAVTALFDPNVSYEDKKVDDDSNPLDDGDDVAGELDGNDSEDKKKLFAIFKQDALVEIIDDYNKRYGSRYAVETHASFKKDLSMRLAHKGAHLGVEKRPAEQLQLLIVVDQLLTGFDSKWINTLYLDKELEYERLIQAFSRTNRLFGHEKPHGAIRYYRYPHSMEQNVKEAFALYSGNREFGLFADKLERNLTNLNVAFYEVKLLFKQEGIENFERLPDTTEGLRLFVKLYGQLASWLGASKIQGFVWGKSSYEVETEEGEVKTIDVEMTANDFYVLTLRYKELGNGGGDKEEIPFDIDATLTEVETGKIDADYLNSQFGKYVKALQSGRALDELLVELHKRFASLSHEDQKYAQMFLTDVQTGTVEVDTSKTFHEYVAEYRAKATNDRVSQCAAAFGLEPDALRGFVQAYRPDADLNAFGRFKKFLDSADLEKAKAYFEIRENRTIPKPLVRNLLDKFLREFIAQGGIDLD